MCRARHALGFAFDIGSEPERSLGRSATISIHKENTMKTYQGSEIRNVAVVGHAHSGKTTLIAALLHAAKMTPTQGRVADGTAVTAYDEEEVARGVTMQNAVAFAEWQGVKINLVDTPGFHMFSHEARAALLPVECAVVLVNAQNGIEAVTERVWRFAEEANVPRIVVVNQMDHPKAGGGGGLSKLIDDLVDRWGRNCVPVQLPISDAQGFHGVVDLVTMEALRIHPGGDGRGKVSNEIPARWPPKRRRGTRRWWNWWPRAKMN
jgi:elongation factor G